MHRKLKKKIQYGTKNLSKGAKSRVRVLADIQNFALSAHCVCTACALRAWHSLCLPLGLCRKWRDGSNKVCCVTYNAVLKDANHKTGRDTEEKTR